MTDTRHPVTRRTVVEHSRHKRQIVVTIGPADTISFRLNGDRRSPAHLSIEKLYDQAELQAAATLTGFNPAPRKGRRSMG